MQSRSGEGACQWMGRRENAAIWENVLRRSFSVSVELNDIACD